MRRLASLLAGLSPAHHSVGLRRLGYRIIAVGLLLALVAIVVARRQSSASRRTVGATYLEFVIAVAVGGGGVDAVARRFAAASWDHVGGRLGVWQDTVRVIKDVPRTGTGLNTFGESMLHYQTVEPATRFAQTHNDYLQGVQL